METKELLMLAGLGINIMATGFIVHKGRLALERRLTRVETLVNVLLKREVPAPLFREAQAAINTNTNEPAQRPIY